MRFWLCLPGNQRPFEEVVPGGRGGRRRLAETYYADCISSSLHSQLLMEQTQLNKKVDTLRQEKKKLQEDWALLKHHLEELKAICKDQEEETSDLKIQQQQVGSGTWYQLRFAIF
ncbi:hypothetical protein ACQP3J_26630, partial [Escherichia coli]